MQENNFIPANYTDAGKIMGTFPIRNALEALVCVVPFVLLVMMLPVLRCLQAHDRLGVGCTNRWFHAAWSS